MRITGKIQMGGSVQSQAHRECSITIISEITQEVSLCASRHAGQSSRKRRPGR